MCRALAFLGSVNVIVSIFYVQLACFQYFENPILILKILEEKTLR